MRTTVYLKTHAKMMEKCEVLVAGRSFTPPRYEETSFTVYSVTGEQSTISTSSNGFITLVNNDETFLVPLDNVAYLRYSTETTVDPKTLDN